MGSFPVRKKRRRGVESDDMAQRCAHTRAACVTNYLRKDVDLDSPVPRPPFDWRHLIGNTATIEDQGCQQ